MLSGEGVRRIVRSYFVSSGFTSELVLGMPCAGSVPTSKPGRPQTPYFKAFQAVSRRAAGIPPACASALRREPLGHVARVRHQRIAAPHELFALPGMRGAPQP